MFIVRALCIAALLFGCGLLSSAAPPPPKKKPNPPKPNPQQQQQAQQQIQRAQQLQALQVLRLQALWNAYLLSRFQMPFVPTFAPGYAYLPNYLPNMRYPAMQPTTPDGTPAGYSRELVLELADTTTYSQLRPGSLTQYQPAKSDALKVNQYINVLAKNDKSAGKPGTWSFPAQITAIDNDAKTITVMAKLDPVQGEFDPANKIITAVTIKAQPTVAQKAAN